MRVWPVDSSNRVVKTHLVSGGDNIGFHEIPTNTATGAKLQSISQLGQALSGGCVRRAPADALFMWNWAPIGTKVVVLP